MAFTFFHFPDKRSRLLSCGTDPSQFHLPTGNLFHASLQHPLLGPHDFSSKMCDSFLPGSFSLNLINSINQDTNTHITCSLLSSQLLG